MLVLLLQEHRSMPELPSTLWADDLQHLDQQQRLLHCSSVSRSLQAAAAAATTELNVRIEDDMYCPAEVYNGAGAPIEKLYGSAKAGNIQAWLAKHGSRVSHLSIHNESRSSVNVEITCEHLQRLQLLSLSNCDLRVKPALLQQGGAAPAEAQAPAPADADDPAAAAFAGLAVAPAATWNPLADLASLTGLELLKYGKVKGPDGRLPSGAVHALSAVSGLQMLRLPDVEEQLLWLPELRQLTILEVRAEAFRQGTGPGVAVPAPFSSMQQLQQLAITHDTHRCRSVYNAQLLEGLPRSLTRLEFAWAVADQLNDSTVPALASLTAMQHLRILSSRRGHNSSHVLPQFLASMQNLRVLQLQGVNRDGLPVLLEVMPGLTQLEDLEISGAPREWPPFAADEDADELPALQYSALLPPSPVLRSRQQFIPLCDLMYCTACTSTGDTSSTSTALSTDHGHGGCCRDSACHAQHARLCTVIPCMLGARNLRDATPCNTWSH
jgi:hypothetical protein